MDRFSKLYEVYCSTDSDSLFCLKAENLLVCAMLKRKLSGFEGFSEMRMALDVFEYDCDPSDPAFIHSINLIINSLEMNEFNSHYNDYNLQDEE